MDKDKESTIKDSNIIKMLKYAAAALSVVSFTTTLNGLNGIVTDNVFLAGLISFAIQAVILIMGLHLINTVNIIHKQDINKILKSLTAFFMIALYIASIAFSSFFSFVFLSDAAYKKVRATDYNTEIEQFLVENTREIKNINDAINDVLLQKIREESPKFSNLLSTYQETASVEVEDIIGNDRVKYAGTQIPDNFKFTSQSALTAYERANNTVASENLTVECQELEIRINIFVDDYENNYYPFYSRLFDELISKHDISKAELRIDEIDGKIIDMRKQIEILESFEHQIGSVNTYVRTCCNGIISRYNALIEQLVEISNVYTEILSTVSVVDANSLDLQNFYESIYSSDALSSETLDDSINELKQIITTYIKNSDEIDSEDIQNLSVCISYLEELNKSRKVRSQIEEFEEYQLNQAYIIVFPTESSQTFDGETNTESESQNISLTSYNYMQMEEAEWREARHKDVASFISILKALPDFELVLPVRNPDGTRSLSNDVNINYLIAKDEENYLSTVLSEAYQYNRAKLEDISQMERAWNYLSSENRFLAVFCMIIAVFLDVASLLIGLFLYICQNERNGESNIKDK